MVGRTGEPVGYYADPVWKSEQAVNLDLALAPCSRSKATLVQYTRKLAAPIAETMVRHSM
ncbi:MAG: hypothetical protein O7H39_02525 [Gammaproteobacteria bacterium]|nr:hypothetical protein [Gammaproteobacteria bacterium]